MSKKSLCCVLILFIICTQSACGAGNFNDLEAQFMDQYYEIIQNVDSNQVDDILLKLQSEENADILNKMSRILQDNKDMRKKNKKKYDKLEELYTGLVELKEAYKNWDSLDFDRKLYLNEQLTHIYAYLSILEGDKKEKSESK